MKTMPLLAAALALAGATAARAQCPPANLSPATLPDANVAQAYAQTITASAGGPYSYIAEGLPAGLSLSSAGALSGMPTAAGAGLVRLIGTDGNGCVATRTLPFTVGTALCATLPVGGVMMLDGASAADFCVNADPTLASEYTLVPVNSADASDINLTALGTGIVPVVGPPTPIPATPAPGLLGGEAPPVTVSAPRSTDLPAFATPEQRARALVQRPAALPATPPAVGDLLDIQVAAGCNGTADVRKGRVESVSPVATPARPRLYMVQEVVEQPVGSGVYVPAVPGGFSTDNFDALRRAWEESPPTTISTSLGGTGTSVAATGMRDTQEANFGALTDVDGNGGVVVFFTRWMNEQSPPASSAVQFARFDARDLFSAASCPLSNAGEIIYTLMPDPTGSVNSNIRTLALVFGQNTRNLIHEVTRLTNAGRRLYVNNAAQLEETWLDEGLAWIAEELAFFNTSVGLTPRSNIVVTNLTTGANASRRVAAFNTYENPLFSQLRSYYLQNATLTPLSGRHMGPLRRTPYSGTGIINTSDQFATTAVFLRYAVDRFNGNDAAFFQALTNATSTGYTNLQAALGGADPNQWARDFNVAMYADDAVAGVAAPYTAPSWNYRSLYTALNGSYQLQPRPLSDSVALSVGYGAGGGPQWLRFGVPAAAAQPALFSLRDGSNAAPPATVGAALVRTK